MASIDSAVDVWKKPPATKSRVSKDQYEANLRSLIKQLKQKEVAVILMTPNALRWIPRIKELYGKPPYDADDPDGFNLFLKAYAETVRQIAKEEHVPLVDVYAAFENMRSRKIRRLRISYWMAFIPIRRGSGWLPTC